MATSVVNPRVQFFANNGRPLIGGRIHTYVAGSSTRARTYKDAAKAQPNTNPIILDGRGEAQIYLAEGVEYKFVVEDSKGALIYTQEPVYGAVWPNAADWPSDAALSFMYMTNAIAAADAIGAVAFYDTFGHASANIASISEGGIVEIFSDEQHAGSRTRYRKESGSLVLKVIFKERDTHSLKDFGAKQSTSICSADQIQAAINASASTLTSLTGNGTYFVSKKLIIPSGAGKYTVDFSGVRIIAAPELQRVIEIGTPGPNPWRGVFREPSIEKAAFTGGDDGIALVNAVEYEIDSPRVKNISKPLAWVPDASCRVTSGTISNPTLQNHEYAIYAAPTGGGYANDNTVITGRFPMNIGGRLIDQIYLDNANGSGVQHNRFIGINLEGWSGGGECGRTAGRCINGANQNVFLFNRSEQYGTGWSAGAAFYFDSSTSGNYVEDTRIDTRVIDDSGFNEWDLPLMGRKKVSHSTAAAGSPAFKYVRRMPVPATNTPYAIDIEDTFTATGNAAFLKYKSARGGGNVIDLETSLGKALVLGADGVASTPYKRGGVTTGSVGYGYRVENSIAGATEVHGFSSGLSAGTGVWAMLLEGTAQSYIGGLLRTTGARTITPATSVVGTLAFSNTSSNTGAVAAEYATNNVATRHHVSFSNPNGVVGSISTSASATSYNTSSDERLKEKIRDADDSGSVIDAIQVRQFDWKVDGKHQNFGFVAQELHGVYPEAVTASDDKDAMWSVDYSKLVPLLVKEVQSLRKRLKMMA